MPKFSATNFDAAFVNLAHRQDRREHMERELARVGIQADRFEAFKPDDFPEPERVKVMRARTPGAIGCYYSQISVIARALKSGRNILVLEDDVFFCDDLPERLRYIEDYLPTVDPEWDVFSLGGCFHAPPDTRGWHKDDHLGREFDRTRIPRIMRVYGSWFTFAYFVRAESAQRVLAALDSNLEQSWGIDHNFITLGDKLRCYCFVPGCAFQIDGKSDIGDGNTIFSGFYALGPHVFKKTMGEFDPNRHDWARGNAAREAPVRRRR